MQYEFTVPLYAVLLFMEFTVPLGSMWVVWQGLIVHKFWLENILVGWLIYGSKGPKFSCSWVIQPIRIKFQRLRINGHSWVVSVGWGGGLD